MVFQQPASTSVTIPAGSSSATITVTPKDDTSIEGSETVILTISSSASYTIGVPSSATVTIFDKDTVLFHPADNGWSSDTEDDWIIGDWELLHAIDVWAVEGAIDGLPIDDWELLSLIDFWAVGHYYWDEVSLDWKKGYK